MADAKSQAAEAAASGDWAAAADAYTNALKARPATQRAHALTHGSPFMRLRPVADAAPGAASWRPAR